MKTYTGGCHCGAVRYRVEADLAQTITCNCSMCLKRGTILAFVPETQFTLEQGEENLTDYQFNTRKIHHLFCATCGILSFARGSDAEGNTMVAINVRCLDDIDLDTIAPAPFDGKNA